MTLDKEHLQQSPNCWISRKQWTLQHQWSFQPLPCKCFYYLVHLEKPWDMWETIMWMYWVTPSWDLWALPYFCLGCLLKSATVTSFSQLHLSRSSCSRWSLDQINLHFLAFYTGGLIKKGKKCEKLSRFFVGMENFTFREMHVDEKSMGKS